MNFCPVCGFTGEFEDFGLVRRRAVKCPTCKSLERHRLLYLYLKNKGIIEGKKLKVLDVAPRKIFSRMFIELGHDYVSIDLAPGRAMKKMDVADLSEFSSETFDLVICYHVLEHVIEDRVAMRELLRVTRPGGMAILQSPIDYKRAETYEDPDVVSPEARLKDFGQADHVRVYGRDYKARLESSGWEVEPDNFAAAMPAVKVEKMRINTWEEMFICFKPTLKNQRRIIAMPKNRAEILAMFSERAPELIGRWPVKDDPFDVPQKENTDNFIEIVKNTYDRKKITSVLDYGCGIGRWAPFWLDGIGVRRYTGIEPVAALAAEAEKRVEPLASAEIILGDMPDTGRRSWDLGFTFTVLEHVPPENIEEAVMYLKDRCKRLLLVEMVAEGPAASFCDFVFKHDHQALMAPWRMTYERMIDRYKSMMIFEKA